MAPLCSLTLMVLALCLATGLAQDDGYQAYPQYNASRYKMPLFQLNWGDALGACQGDGGGAHLVVINSDEEAEVVKELMAPLFGTRQPVAWVGINDILSEGDWVTVLGGMLSASGYDKWAPGEPSQGGCCSDCGHVYTDATYDDVYCSDVQHFICEKPVVP